MQTRIDRQTSSPSPHFICGPDGAVLAILIPVELQSEPGINFFTPPSMNLQVASMNHPEGHLIDPHVHLSAERTILGTSEVIVVRSGEIRTHLFSEMEVYVDSVTLKAGDILLLVGGGHSFEILEESSFIEVKQGPYLEAADKRHFAASMPQLEGELG